MSGRTWKNIDGETAEKVKSHPLENGGTMEEIKSVTEVWISVAPGPPTNPSKLHFEAHFQKIVHCV